MCCLGYLVDSFTYDEVYILCFLGDPDDIVIFIMELNILCCLGDPDDRTLRKVEEDTLVGSVMRERGKAICEKQLLGKKIKLDN